MEDVIRKLADSYVDARVGFANEQAKKWVEERYVLLPTDKNGKPIKLGDFLSYGNREPQLVTSMELGEYGWTLYGDEVFAFRPSSYEIVEPDSIEKLRGDMCRVWNGVHCNGHDCSDVDCEVNEWLKRAEKLFKAVE